MLCRAMTFAFGLRLVPIVLAAVMLVGCAVAVDPNSSPAQQRMAQASQHFNNTVATGAGAGALVGFAAGLATGKLQNALIGAAAGAVVGGVAGYVVAQNNYQHTQTQENLNAAIQDSTQAAQDAHNDAVDSQQIADDARAQAAGLAQAMHAGHITAAQYHSQLASYTVSLKAMEKVSSGLKDKADAIRKSAALAGENGGQLSTSADNIDTSRAEIDQAAEQIRQALATTPSA
jgi:uncharacterized membrane protein